MSINESIPGKIGIFHSMIASGPVIMAKRDGVEKTLLVKHGDKPVSELKWKFCGGKVIEGSTLEANAIREAKEEIGVEVTLLSPLKPMVLWNEIPETGSTTPQAIILIHYLATISAEPIQGKEILAMEWFPLNALPTDLSANVRPVIEEYLKNKRLDSR
jgi:ADP-ribose pyrophosphatase YjhB (NUDIX family)